MDFYFFNFLKKLKRAATLAPLQFPKKNVTVILGISSDKNKQSISKEFKHLADNMIVTKANHPRAGEFTQEELNDFFPGKNIFRTQNVAEAVSLARKISDRSDIILVTGSLFLISEARKLCV